MKKELVTHWGWTVILTPYFIAANCAYDVGRFDFDSCAKNSPSFRVNHRFSFKNLKLTYSEFILKVGKLLKEYLINSH